MMDWIVTGLLIGAVVLGYVGLFWGFSKILKMRSDEEWDRIRGRAEYFKSQNHYEPMSVEELNEKFKGTGITFSKVKKE